MVAALQGAGGAAGLVAVRARRAEPGSAGVEPVEPAVALSYVAYDRRSDFLAQLIAVRDGMAQTRERRRAAPEHAVNAYRAASGLGRARGRNALDVTL
jgi:hypothetical protein